jgi:hypothetical protein
MRDIVEPLSWQDLKLSAEQVGRELLDGGEGTFVSDDYLSDAFGVAKTDVKFNVGCLKLKSFLRQHDVFVVRTRNPNGYRYATDPEHVDELIPQKLKAMRQALAAAEHVAAATDVERLDDSQRRKLEHARGYAAFVRQSMMSARKKFEVPQLEASVEEDDAE